MVLCRYIFTLSFLLVISIIDISGQIPVIKRPQPATLSTGVIVGHPDSRVNPTPNMPSFPNFNNNRYRQQQEMYEHDRMEVERRNMEMMRMYSDIPGTPVSIHYDLPFNGSLQGTEHFYRTAKKLQDMLEGKTPLDLKDAVFSVENAFFEGQLDRKKYEERISEMVTIAKSKAIQDGYNWNNPVARNMILYRVMADTLSVKLPGQEKPSVSFPVQYDFEDFWGKEDHSKLFVTKLLTAHTGQCHSMPLLYLILCEATGTEAYLAFAPQHSYIKFHDKQNNWYNIELTNGKIVSDAFVTVSGYINSASIKSGIYMKPQDRKQVIAHCLSDLASSYITKYGYDGFVNQCVDTVLSYAPGNTTALAIKSNYLGERLLYVAGQIGSPPLDILKANYPLVYKMLEERNSFYKKMDDMGYTEMPLEIYEKWLNSVNEEKERREHDIRYKNILRLIK